MFGFLGSGIVRLRKEIFVVQKENKLLEMKLEDRKEQVVESDKQYKEANNKFSQTEQDQKSVVNQQSLADVGK